jgi:hypothetical protein
MAKQALRHQAADGGVATRQTDRAYTHVVVTCLPDGSRPCVTNWCGSEALARTKAASREHNYTREAGRVATVEAINNGTRN